MSKIVSHTPVEVEAFAALMGSLDFIDLLRETTPEPQKLASWWSYRAQDFRVSNRGLRLECSVAGNAVDDVRPDTQTFTRGSG